MILFHFSNHFHFYFNFFIIIHQFQQNVHFHVLFNLQDKMREMATRKSLLNTVYMIGFNVEFT